MKKKTDDYSSVQKALEILLAFTPDGPKIGTLELSRKLDMHKSTVSRLVGVLTYHNFLSQDSESKKYMLGQVVADLGNAADRSMSNNLCEVAQPVMDKLRDLIGESVGLEAIQKNKIAVIAHSEGSSVVRVAHRLNEAVPVHAAAGAKTILAFSPPEVFERMITRKLHRFTPNTITNRKELREHLKRIAEQGVSFDHGELDEDVHAVAAPVFDHNHQPVAAIVTAMIESKMTRLLKDNLIANVKKAATDITEGLK